jgi:hypothetical protein
MVGGAYRLPPTAYRLPPTAYRLPAEFGFGLRCIHEEELVIIRTLCLVVALLLAAPGAGAAPYWVSYEGNDYPENEGWTRYSLYGGAQRSFEDDSFVLDSRASTGICDFYQMFRSGATDPGPGETFVMDWQLRVDEVVGPWDTGVGVYADGKWAVGFDFNRTNVYSAFEPGVGASFSPGVFHHFQLTSTDMRNYVLSIDGEEAIRGAFWLSLFSSQVWWGDETQGGASLSHWDYFRFGVVPEPKCLPLILAGVLILKSPRT